MNQVTHYNLADYKYVIRSDGYKSKRYNHWCSICKKNRGYGYKNKVIKESMCHSCKMSQLDVRAKIQQNSKKLKHSDITKEKISSALHTRYGTSPINRKIARNLRARLCKAVTFNWRSGSAVKDLGCSISELKKYLESKFKLGMTWDNYGDWHIDHIVPLSKFDLSNREELLKACHYTNLQPLWAKENLEKRHVDGTF